jgi:dihydroorotate dehydrogenase electron transfer subunit
MGLAPLLFLAKRLKAKPVLMLGTASRQLFWEEEFSEHCSKIYLTTDDGSAGRKGTVINYLPEVLADNNIERIYGCGPRPMLASLILTAKDYRLPCQISLEEHMACGVGACLSCNIKHKDGQKKVCSDGPVFWAEEVLL